MARSKRPDETYEDTIKCVDCGRARWTKPQDTHVVKRCNNTQNGNGCQEKHKKATRAKAQRERRAELRKRTKRVSTVAAVRKAA